MYTRSNAFASECSSYCIELISADVVECQEELDADWLALVSESGMDSFPLGWGFLVTGGGAAGVGARNELAHDEHV